MGEGAASSHKTKEHLAKETYPGSLQLPLPPIVKGVNRLATEPLGGAKCGEKTVFGFSSFAKRKHTDPDPVGVFLKIRKTENNDVLFVKSQVHPYLRPPTVITTKEEEKALSTLGEKGNPA